MVRSKRIAVNLSFTFLSRATEIVAGLFIVGILSRYLGLEDFGRYSVLMAIGWVALPILNMGFPRILVREISQRKEKAPDFIMIGWSWNILTTLLLLIGLLCISLQYEIKDIEILLIISLTTGIMAITQTAGSLYIAFQRMQYETIPTLTTMLILIGLIAIGVYYDLGLTYIFSAYAFAYLTGLAVTIKLTCSLTPYLRNLKKTFLNLQGVNKVLKESFHIGIFQILVQVYLYTGVFFLKMMAANADVALFQAPFRIFTRMQIIPMTFMPVLLPVFSQLFFAKDKDELQKITQAVFKCMMIISLILTFFSFSLADSIIPLLLGSDFTASSSVFKILSLSICFFFLNTIFDALFIASKKIKFLTYIQCTGLFFCALVNVILVPETTSLGSSWAIVISSGIIFMANFYFFKDLLKGVLAKTVLITITGGLIGSFVDILSKEMNMLLSLSIGIILCIFCIFIFRIISMDDIIRLINTIKPEKKQDLSNKQTTN